MSASATKSILWAGTSCAVLALAGLWAWRAAAQDDAASRADLASPSSSGAPLAAALSDRAGNGERDEVALDVGPQDQPDATPAADADASAERLVRASAELRTALEASLYDSLDPGAILDAALSLGSLEVDPRPFSEPDPSGCTVYPLVGTPEGTKAELWVGRSSKPGVAKVLSLRFELDPSEMPYLFMGCARTKAIAQVQMQIGSDGAPLNLTILTDLPPSSRNRDLDVPLDVGSISQGVLCYVDARDPSDWRARTHGLEDGKPGSWENTTLLLAGRWPCPDKLDAFSHLLQSQYETIRH
jgi:hypothetical protein